MSTTKRLRDIPISVLDLAPIVVGSTPAVALRNSLDLARHAERWGFNRYWLAEHHNMTGIASSATSVVIGYIAGGTSTIRVGSGGIMLPNHAPLVIAEQFGTLESLYPGRIDLGLGRAPGTDQVTAQALRRGPERYGEDFPESVAELRAFLEPAEEPNTRRVRAVPGEGLNIPIWLLGSSDFSARMAGQLGLPFGFASHFSPNFTLPALATYRHYFQPSEVLEAPYAMVGVNVIAAETDEEAHWLATSMQQQFLGLIRGRPGQLNPPVESMEGLWTDAEKAALEERQSSTIIGSPETVRMKMQAFLDQTQADEIIVNAQIFDHAKRLHSYEIVSQVSGRE
ncbi:LLM class flavin-dependent oxidoreductase [Tumebacillus permanentifrigoris]|uniref:Luciferase family oxidoreductase group 1 n=1 Tax=Tumebacillus permanentifrigoris TaxID=378543 RepID=A0A316D8F9_9BACL|nr:LLM class flavin-dependent oxidoreductase [Tumebacillus permanentifrigoris]PWK13076.1 luciferase family oxidoreductase group 1 [Tumebacillus permanentifrigoris]